MEAVLADESIPYGAVKACRAAGVDILSVVELATGATDQRVLELSRTHHRLLVTLDADMAHAALRSGPEGCWGAMLLRLRPGGAKGFAGLMLRILNSPRDLVGMYTVLYRDRLRQFPLGGEPKPDPPETP